MWQDDFRNCFTYWLFWDNKKWDYPSCQIVTVIFLSIIFFYMYICIFPYLYIFTFSYFHNRIFSYFQAFLFLYIFHIFYLNFSIIRMSDYEFLYIWLNICVWLYFNVCMACFYACILSYLLWQVSHERQGMLTQWPAPDPMG